MVGRSNQLLTANKLKMSALLTYYIIVLCIGIFAGSVVANLDTNFVGNESYSQMARRYIETMFVSTVIMLGLSSFFTPFVIMMSR